MGQKVHPLGFRIGVTQTHRSQWFAKPKDYANLVKEDLIIRDYVAQQLSNASISRLIFLAKSIVLRSNSLQPARVPLSVQKGKP